MGGDAVYPTTHAQARNPTMRRTLSTLLLVTLAAAPGCLADAVDDGGPFVPDAQRPDAQTFDAGSDMTPPCTFPSAARACDIRGARCGSIMFEACDTTQLVECGTCQGNRRCNDQNQCVK